MNHDKNSYARDHMANERTFLAWIRTSIGIIAFGFVIEKFSLFIREITYVEGKENLSSTSSLTPPLAGYSAFLGLALIALGIVMSLLAFIRFRIVTKQLNQDTYKPSIWLNVMITMTVLFIGLFLILFTSK